MRREGTIHTTLNSTNSDVLDSEDELAQIEKEYIEGQKKKQFNSNWNLIIHAFIICV